MENIWSNQLRVDDCVFYRRYIIFTVYAEDRNFASSIRAAIYQAIRYIGEKFNIKYQVTLENYIGFNVEAMTNGKIKLSQTHLIN